MKILTVILILVIFGFWAHAARKKHVMNKAREMAQEVFPVWAAQGPFESGTESAMAMWAAWVVVFDLERAQKNKETFLGHREAYDAEPDTWANLRQRTVQQHGESNMWVPMAEAMAVSALRNGHLEWLTDGQWNAE